LRHGPVVACPEENCKNDPRMEHLSYEDRLRELWLFSLEKSLRGPDSGLSVSKGEIQERRGQTLQQSLWSQNKEKWFQIKRGEI